MSEVRAVLSLALLYVFRMLGLFMVLPVLMLYGDEYLGSSPQTLGLALGIYGLTQACFQIPLGLLSDLVGRKSVIIGGLMMFALGSIVAAVATTVEGLIIGRALQGSGAIAGATMAMVADLTSEQNRTKAMAVIGASIGLSFSIAMILGPAIASVNGLEGIFFFSALLAALGIAIVVLIVPTPQGLARHRDMVATPAMIKKTVENTELMRLNLGIFVLHCSLMTIFVSLPGVLEQTLNIVRENHWYFYLPVLIGAFLAMLPLMLLAEKKRKVRPVFVSAVALLSGSCGGLIIFSHSLIWLVVLVFFFFVAFNLLESVLPSLVSKTSPAGTRGTAMGVYSTCQFLGAFVGGTAGGWLLESFSYQSVFSMACVLTGVWLVVACFMEAPRHLASLCVPVETAEDAEKVASMKGVVDAFHAVEESLMYLKVDRECLDEFALHELTGSAAN